MMTKNVKKTKIIKRPDGKVEISKENDAALVGLVGKKPSELKNNEIGMLLDVIVDELWGLDELGRII